MNANESWQILIDIGCCQLHQPHCCCSQAWSALVKRCLTVASLPWEMELLPQLPWQHRCHGWTAIWAWLRIRSPKKTWFFSSFIIISWRNMALFLDSLHFKTNSLVQTIPDQVCNNLGVQDATVWWVEECYWCFGHGHLFDPSKGWIHLRLNELWCGNCWPLNMSTMARKAVQAINERLGGDGSEMLEASQLKGS